MKATICLLPGDGIGPEVNRQAVDVLAGVAETFGHDFRFESALIGGAAMDETGSALPKESLDLAAGSNAILFGAIGGPKWDNPFAKVRPELGLLEMRKSLDLFANLRPVKVSSVLINSSTIKPEVLEGADIMIVRELTGGIYFGDHQEATQEAGSRQAVDTLSYTEREINRILEIGFELAAGRKGRLASVDKANVLASSRLWRALADEMAPRFPNVELEHVLVDAMSMFLIRRPATFDVIVTENLFGDILTDEASMLTGSLGMLPSASLGARTPGSATRIGVYEPIHGAAPDIAGLDKANPCASILSAAMLLRYSLGLEKEAVAVETAVETSLERGLRTADVAEPQMRIVGTQEMGEAIVAALASPNT